MIVNTLLQRAKHNRLILVGLFVVIVLIGYNRLYKSSSQTPQYQTSAVEQGNLIVSISASGQVSTANNSQVNTNVSGVVTKVYVQNSQFVKSGSPILELELSQASKQAYTQALASYQNAKNSLENAKIAFLTTQATMFTNWDSFKELAENTSYTNSDGSPNHIARALPKFHIAQNNWLASEATYKNQQNVVSQAQTALNSSWLSLQQSSPILYAPISGTVDGLSLSVGSVIGEAAADSSTKIANITTMVSPTITINLTEIDITKVKLGNKATITIDALSDKTFTGVVLSIDSVGSQTSGVTSYPVVIALDSQNDSILPNMSASVNIITDVKNDVLLVPSSAVKTQNDSSYVQILVNGQPQDISIETGLSSDTQTEIISGLDAGQEVITTTIAPNSQTTTGQSQSPFSGLGNRSFGGAVRINR